MSKSDFRFLRALAVLLAATDRLTNRESVTRFILKGKSRARTVTVAMGTVNKLWHVAGTTFEFWMLSECRVIFGEAGDGRDFVPTSRIQCEWELKVLPLEVEITVLSCVLEQLVERTESGSGRRARWDKMWGK